MKTLSFEKQNVLRTIFELVNDAPSGAGKEQGIISSLLVLIRSKIVWNRSVLRTRDVIKTYSYASFWGKTGESPRMRCKDVVGKYVKPSEED